MTPLDMRLCLLSHGFEPTPVNGKAAVMKGWQTCDVTPDQIRIWDRRRRMVMRPHARPGY
jgi:hypothetical protein